MKTVLKKINPGYFLVLIYYYGKIVMQNIKNVTIKLK